MFEKTAMLTTLGALVGIAVFSNIFALNLGYDLPIKIYSLHILLVCLFLVLPDAPRLVRFFLLNQEVASLSENGLFHLRRLNTRSEEHTSELQSQSNLVCRLLLEKKKSRPRRRFLKYLAWVRLAWTGKSRRLQLRARARSGRRWVRPYGNALVGIRLMAVGMYSRV